MKERKITNIVAGVLVILLLVLVVFTVYTRKSSEYKSELSSILAIGDTDSKKVSSTKLTCTRESDNLKISDIYLNETDNVKQIRMIAAYNKPFVHSDIFEDVEISLRYSNGDDVTDNVTINTYSLKYYLSNGIGLVLEMDSETLKKVNDSGLVLNIKCNDGKAYADAVVNLYDGE